MGDVLEPKLKVFFSQISVSVLNKLVQIFGILGGDLGAHPPAAFYNFFFEKNNFFSAILITFRMLSELFERTKLLKFENNS